MDGSGAVAAALADVGITQRLGWVTGAIVFGVGGLLCLVWWAAGPASVPPNFVYVGAASLSFGGLSLWGAARIGSSRWLVAWGTEARLCGGLAILVAGIFVLGGQRPPSAALMLIGLPTAAYMVHRWIAVVYLVVVTSILAAALWTIDEPARLAHTLVTTLLCAMTGAALLVSKERTRYIARRNRQLANTDALTGVANLRRLRGQISALTVRGTEHEDFALFAMDLDNFKHVNDVFDHSTGDRVLCKVAAALAGAVEPTDLVARRGGDEFAVLVTIVGGRDLDAQRDHLAGVISNARAAACPAIVPSASVAYVRSHPGENMGSLMERADDALHDAKLASRRRRGISASRSVGLVAATRLASNMPTATEPGEAVRPQTSMGRVRARLHVAGSRAIVATGSPWVGASILLGVVALGLGLVSLPGLVPPLSPAEGGAIAGLLLVTALACTVAGAHSAPLRWLHLPWLLGLGLVALATALAGRSGSALLDFVPLMVLYGFLLFGSREAMVYLVLGDAAYVALAVGRGFPDAIARSLVTVVCIALIAGLIAKLRTVSVGFARRNRELAEVDSLTGVANLRAAKGRLAYAVRRAGAERLRPAVVTIDLDEFKPTNDEHSHSTGDKVLQAVARAISTAVRLEDLLARRGGDEFLVVIDDTDPEHLDEVGQRIGDAIVRARRRVCPDLCPTASIASVEWQAGEAADDLLRRADEALHTTKLAGRERRNVVLRR